METATTMSLFACFRAYVDHPDPPAAAANLIAVIVGLNGPFYPLYVVALIGTAGWESAATMAASPLFLAVPWIARKSSLAGRIALTLIGTAQTVWSTKLLGVDSHVQLFCLPCIVLSALVFRAGERRYALLLTGAAVVPLVMPLSAYGTALIPLTVDEAAALARMNAVCVAMTLALVTLQFRRLLAMNDAGPSP